MSETPKAEPSPLTPEELAALRQDVNGFHETGHCSPCNEGRPCDHVRLLATIAASDAEIKADRAFCICGCPVSEHESYGEDGEACENPIHECFRVCAAAASYVVHVVARVNAERDAERDILKADLFSMTAEGQNLANRLRERTEELGQEIEARKKAEEANAAVEADNAALRAELETLRPAARKLINEVAALGAFDSEVRRAVGNTNMNVLFLRRLELERAISVAPEETEACPECGALWPKTEDQEDK